MKAKFFGHIVVGILFLTACSDEKNYVLEGSIIGLDNPIIYIETFSDKETKRDTLLSKEGAFRFVSSAHSMEPIIVYMEEDLVWITVWAKNGELIRITGNADNPELIEFTGNEINDLLTQFRQNNKTIIEKKNKSDNALSKAELYQILTQRSRNFIQEHPSSIASLVLIQDYVIQGEDPEIIGETLSLIKSPAKENQLYKQLEQVYHLIRQYQN